MTQMSMGSNIALTATLVRAALRWTGGPGVPDVDASAILLEEDGEIGSEADFVFYNQPEHPSGSVRMAGKTGAPQASDQVDVDLARVPAGTTRIVLAASSDGGPFGRVPDLQLVLSDIGSGAVLASFPMQAADETAFVSAELYRRNDAWKFRAVGQGYATGLAGLAKDFGIDAGDPAPAAPASAPAPVQPAPVQAAPVQQAPAAAPPVQQPPVQPMPVQPAPAQPVPVAQAPQPAATGSLLDLGGPAETAPQAPAATAVPMDLDAPTDDKHYLPSGPPATSDLLDLSVPPEYRQPPA